MTARAVTPTLDVEAELFAGGASVIIGMDEVGRGALAGPVVVGVCAIATVREFPDGLRDSKLMTERRRTVMVPALREWGMCATGAAEATEIDEWGITRSLGLAGHRALVTLFEAGVSVGNAIVILDGKHDWLTPVLSSPVPVITRVGADQTCASVAAASVIAKVWRDELMINISANHPEYAWESNKGYGAAVHLEAIERIGPTTWHRRTWLHGV